MNNILVLITTESDKKKAKYVAKLLVKKKLAACVSIKKIFSIYQWNDNIEETKEFEIKIKSKPALKDELIMFLQKITSQEIPQIIFKKFKSEDSYYKWLIKTI